MVDAERSRSKKKKKSVKRRILCRNVVGASKPRALAAPSRHNGSYRGAGRIRVPTRFEQLSPLKELTIAIVFTRRRLSEAIFISFEFLWLECMSIPSPPPPSPRGLLLLFLSSLHRFLHRSFAAILWQYSFILLLSRRFFFILKSKGTQLILSRATTLPKRSSWSVHARSVDKDCFVSECEMKGTKLKKKKIGRKPLAQEKKIRSGRDVIKAGRRGEGRENREGRSEPQ